MSTSGIISEAELKPGMTHRMSVQRNTEELLMGCRGDGGRDLGRGGGVRQDTVKQHQWLSEDTRIIGCDLSSNRHAA